jgi:hypothetical protein
MPDTCESVPTANQGAKRWSTKGILLSYRGRLSPQPSFGCFYCGKPHKISRTLSQQLYLFWAKMFASKL